MTSDITFKLGPDYISGAMGPKTITNDKLFPYESILKTKYNISCDLRSLGQIQSKVYLMMQCFESEDPASIIGTYVYPFIEFVINDWVHISQEMKFKEFPPDTYFFKVNMLANFGQNHDAILVINNFKMSCNFGH